MLQNPTQDHFLTLVSFEKIYIIKKIETIIIVSLLNSFITEPLGDITKTWIYNAPM